MKKYRPQYVLFFLLLFAGNPLFAQQCPYKKDKPVQFFYFITVPLGYYGSYKEWYVKKMSKNGFSGDQAKALMDRITTSADRPSRLEEYSRNAQVLSHYKAYELFYSNRVGMKHSVVWVPYDENQHLPEGLRPTNKDGFVALVEARGLTENGVTDNGVKLALAGSPVTAGELSTNTPPRSATTTSGVTASRVQSSSGVDMSAFTNPFLGCMVYVNSIDGIMYVVPVEGKTLTSQSSVADAAFRFAVNGGSYTKYEWMPGVEASAVYAKFKSSLSVNVQRTYTLK